jgi:hypothetical protein
LSFLGRDRERQEAFFLFSSSGTEEAAGLAAPAGRGGAGGERRGRGDALVCAHPREVVAPPKTTYGTLATSAGGMGRRQQAMMVLW